MDFITTFKLGYEIKFKEKLYVIGWQVLKEYPNVMKLCSKFTFWIQSYLHYLEYEYISSGRLKLSPILLHNAISCTL